MDICYYAAFVLSEEIMKALYPDTCYGKDSGGDPRYIPTLTYEQICEAHRTFYSPSNARIFLDGKMIKAKKYAANDIGFVGDITEVYPDKAKLRAMVSIFGRETPVELEYKQIQKI